ncbi:leucine-, glutamate- and lysine-rich protein 1-like [Elysia marginata]|uniref:Leucine-, glutamate- and lysine-rich protein 1-like n=1 Tax=Elysia marginata TaxID=1093978 RepID=A0AAV4IE53_9GAST|nr:leucine-, glutamate- and lysine-rich protein 1-like [Elysia marginata]
MEDNSEDNDFTHYTPQHPLPEEIKKLARDDTVCKYCGVSYLIHNEIKALEDKLATQEKELTKLRGQEEREELLKKENSLLKDQRNDLQHSLETERKLVADLTAEVQSLKDKQKILEDSVSSYKDKYMKNLRQFSALSQVVRQQKENIKQIRDQITKGQEEISGLAQTMKENVKLIAQTAETECNDLQSQVQCLDMEKLVLTQSNSTLTANLQAVQQKLADTQQELSAEKETISKLEKNMQDSDSLSESLKQAKKSLQNSQRELESSNKTYETCKTELEQCRAQLSAKTVEVKEMASKISDLEKNHELGVQRLTLDLKAKEGEVLQGLKQQKTLENKLKELEKREAERQHSQDRTLNEANDLKESLQRAKADRDALKAERELMIDAHQNRIEELRESFKNKMAEMDNWPQKLQAAVVAEKAKHQNEMKALEENLKHNFVMELQIEKDKYNELLKKFQMQERDKNNMRQAEHAQFEQKYKQEIEELKRQISEGKVRYQEREEELQEEIASLKKIIHDLQNRLARLDSEGSGEATQLKATLANVQQQLSEMESNMAGADAKLKEAQEESKFLQNIVQKECEERFELTEALSEARRQLLELKRPPGGYPSSGSKHGSVVSLGSTHSASSREGKTVSQSPLPTAHTEVTPAPPSLSKRIEQKASNILLSYSKNNATRSSSGNSKNEEQLRESRMRIAQMMGRIS